MKKVKAFPQTRNRRYDWDVLLDGNVYLLDADDLPENVKSFRTQAHSHASERHLKVRTLMTEEGLYVQAYTP